jgi:hypothetical protein
LARHNPVDLRATRGLTLYPADGGDSRARHFATLNRQMLLNARALFGFPSCRA